MLQSCADRRHRYGKELRARRVPAARRAVPGCRRAGARRARRPGPKRPRRSRRGSAPRFSRPMDRSIGASSGRSCSPMRPRAAISRRSCIPAVYRAIAAGCAASSCSADPIAVVDVPLLYETGAEKDFDRVIVTACPPERQMARLVGRGLTRGRGPSAPGGAVADGRESRARRFRDQDRQHVRGHEPSDRNVLKVLGSKF